MFLGIYDTKPDPKIPNNVILEYDYAFLRDDGYMVIAPAGVSVDGASIPRFAWVFVGHPFYKMNKYWSVHHDVLYSKHAIILNVNNIPPHLSPSQAFEDWHKLKPSYFSHQQCFNKRFADDTLRQAMEELDEPWLKRRIVYRSVRWFGRGWWK